MMTRHQLRRWLAREIHGREIPRKPPARSSTLHAKPARSARYRAWVRSLPCAVCGSAETEACHTGPHALGSKASDFTCIPLCREHHRAGNFALDKIGRPSFERTFNLEIQQLVERLNDAWRLLWQAA